MEALMEILKEMHPEVDFEKEQNLVGDMILDSFDLVSLISEVEEAYEVRISAKDIVPENFNSARSMYAFIERLKGEK